jgi:two-component system KDP operon response regulator KdpE
VAETILVVDDDASVRKFLRVVLEEAGYSVVEASNGKEALQEVGQREPNLILLDLVMPDVEGIETLVGLRRKGITAKIVVISGKAEYLGAAKLIGADAVLLKPVGYAELTRLVQTLLGGG